MKSYSPTDIYNIYKKHCVKNNSYYKKYEYLPFERMEKSWDWDGKDFPRVPCVLDFSEWVAKYDLMEVNNLLYTCDSDPELNYLNIKNKKLIEYDFSTNNNDLHKLQLAKEEFDFVLFNQTLEHLYDPEKALKNLHKCMKVGSHIFTSVPVINIPHMTPVHFWGINKMGLSLLFDSAGFEILEIGEWGNFDYISSMFEKQTWPDYKQLMKNNKIVNEEHNACQCWILAKKI
jgi:SAM-dependent methyltransferase